MKKIMNKIAQKIKALHSAWMSRPSVSSGLWSDHLLIKTEDKLIQIDKAGMEARITEENTVAVSNIKGQQVFKFNTACQAKRLMSGIHQALLPKGKRIARLAIKVAVVFYLGSLLMASKAPIQTDISLNQVTPELESEATQAQARILNEMASGKFSGKLPQTSTPAPEPVHQDTDAFGLPPAPFSE